MDASSNYRKGPDELHQRVVKNYRKLRRRGLIAIVFALLVFIITGFLCYRTAFHTTKYENKINDFDQQITALEAEREGILDGTIDPETITFDDALEENLAGLRDYPRTENNYEVPIEGTRATLTINRNNIFISDNAGILSSGTKDKIYNLNKELAASTNGSQLMVVTVPELPRGEDIESFANAIFNQLGIGNAQDNNGVLYLIALEDREFRLEVGYGLEGTLTDSRASDIIDDDNVVEAFQEEDYNTGVNYVLDEVFDVMNSKTALVDSKISAIEDDRGSAIFYHWFMMIIMGGLALTNLILIFLLIRGRSALKGYFNNYQEVIPRDDIETALGSKIKKTELYYILMSGMVLALTATSVRRAVTQGRLLQTPGAKKMGLGRVLVGDTLYSGDGYILTTAYLASNYNASNHSSGSGSGGGGSWGSFGGGSSGGGGASGGW